MRFTKFNKSIILFIAVSIAVHLCLLVLLLINGNLDFPSKNIARMKISLQSLTKTKEGETKDISEESDIEAKSAIKNHENIANSSKTESQDNTQHRSSGWGVGKTPENIHNALNSEKSALQSRLNIERQQRLSSISGNVAQLIGRLNQEAVTASCALFLSQDGKNGYLKCSPDQFNGQIQFGLAPANIFWVNSQTELGTSPLCIPIQIRNAPPAC